MKMNVYNSAVFSKVQNFSTGINQIPKLIGDVRGSSDNLGTLLRIFVEVPAEIPLGDFVFYATSFIK